MRFFYILSTEQTQEHNLKFSLTFWGKNEICKPFLCCKVSFSVTLQRLQYHGQSRWNALADETSPYWLSDNTTKSHDPRNSELAAG